MASKVLLELKVDDKGSLKIVEKEAKSAASATDRLSKKTKDLGKARSRYHKQEKGVGQAGLSTAKSFSKLNQTIGGGSSGLVGAYAVLAANVFAATAAFGVFQRAAQFDDLIRGLEFVGNAAGRNLPEVSKRLKEITNSAISTESAMRATALATGAGFSVEQLEGLTKVAKGASIALGRDLTDALDRLVRGTAKLEPEILDELGIMVRLDTAVQNYASALGKNAEALTDFDRRQAFLNETLKQGEKKYFDVADAIDTNPYDKLAASLSNLQKSLIGFVNNTLKLNVAIDFFANNIAALTGVATLFGSTLLKSITPALFNLDAAAASSAAAFASQRLSMLDSIGVAEKMPKRYEEALAPIREGVGTTEDFAKATDSLAASDKKYTSLKKTQEKVLQRSEFLLGKNEKRQKNLETTQKSLTRLQKAAIKGNRDEVKSIIEGNKALQTRFGGTRNLVKSLEGADEAQLKAIGSGKDFELAQGKIDKIINKTKKSISGYSRAIETSGENIAGYSAQIAINGQRVGELDEVQKAQTASTARHTRATAIQQAATGSMIGAFGTLKQSMSEENETQKRNTESKGKAAKAAGLLKVGLFGASGGVRILLAGFASLLPFLGIFISVGTVLFSFLKDKFFPEDLVKNRIDDAIKSFESFVEIQDQFQETAANRAGALGSAYIAYAGVIDQIKSKLADVTRFSLNATTAQLASVTANIAKAQAEIDRLEGKGVGTGSRPKTGPGNRKANRDRQSDERSLVGLQKTKNDLLDEEKSLRAELIEGQRKSFDTVSREAEVMLRARIAQAAAMKEVDPDNIDPFGLGIVARDADKIKEIRDRMNNDLERAKDIAKDTDKSVEEVQTNIIATAHAEMAVLQNTAGNISAAFSQVEVSVSEANKVINKSIQSTKKPFEDIENAVKGVASNFKFAKDRVAELEEELKKNPGNKEARAELADYREVIKALEKDITNLKIGEKFKDGEKGLDRFLGTIATFQRETAQLTKEISQLTKENKVFQDAAKGIAGAETILIQNTNDLLEKRLEFVNKAITAEKELLEGAKDDTTELTKLQAERAAIIAQQIGPLELAAKVRRQEVTDLKDAAALEQARLKTLTLRQKITAVMNSPGGQLSPAKQFEFDSKAADAKILAVEAEIAGARLRLEIEKAILMARFTEDGTDLSAREQQVLGLLDKQMQQTINIGREKLKQARAEKQLLTATTLGSTTGFSLDNMPPQQAAIIKGQQKLATAMAAQKTAQNDLNKLTTKQKELRDDMIAKDDAYMNNRTQENFDSAAQATDAYSDVKQAVEDQVNLVANTGQTVLEAQRANVVAVLQGTAEAFRAMGPEGEMGAALASAQATLVGSINSSLQVLDSTESTAAEKTQARLAIMSSAVSTISQIQQAASNARIAAIDKEIEAEKKRDGQSAKSVERIKALEKKKEAQQKKAFEMNKKMMMAQTVISTAAGIAGVLSGIKDPIATAPLAFATAVLIGAMGAAQLAMIAGTSFQGGGSISTGGMPTSISAGNRRDSVDISRSQSTRGELAYMRGVQGTGGPENFKPAFYGSRMRAAGGETTGYMVGEQGPELFVPDRPGTVVSNDDVADTIATPVNATFNINTIDASGVEDILVAQRGNIIGMIREGANSYGQGFLEEVDTSIYTPSAGGVSRY